MRSRDIVILLVAGVGMFLSFSVEHDYDEWNDEKGFTGREEDKNNDDFEDKDDEDDKDEADADDDDDDDEDRRDEIPKSNLERPMCMALGDYLSTVKRMGIL